MREESTTFLRDFTFSFSRQVQQLPNKNLRRLCSKWTLPATDIHHLHSYFPQVMWAFSLQVFQCKWTFNSHTAPSILRTSDTFSARWKAALWFGLWLLKFSLLLKLVFYIRAFATSSPEGNGDVNHAATTSQNFAVLDMLLRRKLHALRQFLQIEVLDSICSLSCTFIFLFLPSLLLSSCSFCFFPLLYSASFLLFFSIFLCSSSKVKARMSCESNSLKA